MDSVEVADGGCGRRAGDVARAPHAEPGAVGTGLRPSSMSMDNGTVPHPFGVRDLGRHATRAVTPAQQTRMSGAP